MLAQKDFVRVYETLVKEFPWMDDTVKITMHMKRKDVLLLTEMAQRGLAIPELRALVNDETKDVLETVIAEMLAKGNLNEFMNGVQNLLVVK